MWPWLSFRTVGSLIALGIWLLQATHLMALDRVIIGHFPEHGAVAELRGLGQRLLYSRRHSRNVVLIGSTDTLIQALIAGQINVAIVDPSAAINAVERGASLKIIGGTVPIAAYTLVGCPKYKSIKELKGTTIGVVSLVSGSTIFLREMLKAKEWSLIAITRLFKTAPPGSDWQALTGATPRRL